MVHHMVTDYWLEQMMVVGHLPLNQQIMRAGHILYRKTKAGCLFHLILADWENNMFQIYVGISVCLIIFLTIVVESFLQTIAAGLNKRTGHFLRHIRTEHFLHWKMADAHLLHKKVVFEKNHILLENHLLLMKAGMSQ